MKISLWFFYWGLLFGLLFLCWLLLYYEWALIIWYVCWPRDDFGLLWGVGFWLVLWCRLLLYLRVSQPRRLHLPQRPLLIIRQRLLPLYHGRGLIIWIHHIFRLSNLTQICIQYWRTLFVPFCLLTHVLDLHQLLF